MGVSLKTKDLQMTNTGDFRLSLSDTGIDDIKSITNEENEILMQNIILRLSSNKSDWATINNSILPIDFGAFLGLPLNESLLQTIVERIISSLVFDNLLSVNEITVANTYFALNECYIAFKIRPKNNPTYRKSLIISYDSYTNILTPTVIDYIER